MNKNLYMCSAVECTAAQNPQKKKNPFMFFFVSVLLLSSVERFVVSHTRDFYYIHVNIHMEKRVKAMSAHRLIQRTLPNGYLWRHISQPLNQLVEEVVITATL